MTRAGSEPMTPDEIEAGVEYLESVIQGMRNGRIRWFALRTRFVDGNTIAIHSKHAPDRPKGVRGNGSSE